MQFRETEVREKQVRDAVSQAVDVPNAAQLDPAEQLVAEYNQVGKGLKRKGK